MLDVRIKETPRAAVAYLRGEADCTTCAQLLRNLEGILESHPLQLIVVMDDLRYVDSRGLGALVGAFHRACNLKCHFCVVTSDPQMTRVLELTGLSEVMDLQPSEYEALSHNPA